MLVHWNQKKITSRSRVSLRGNVLPDALRHEPAHAF